MRLSLLGVSISLFGIALILASDGTFGIVISFIGLVVSLVSCLRMLGTDTVDNLLK